MVIYNMKPKTILFPELLRFEWDRGNERKNKEKHGVEQKECEEIFFNDPLIHLDIKHSITETRLFALGKTREGRYLCLIFTVRKECVRVISARDQSKEERSAYTTHKRKGKKR